MSAIEQLVEPVSLLLSYEEQYKRRHTEKRGGDLGKGNAFLAFRCGEKDYLLEMSSVLEVVTDKVSASSLPFSKPWLLGLVNHRGEIYSVVDFLLYSTKSNAKASKISNYLFLRGVADGYVLKVGEVFGIRSLTANVEATPDATHSWIAGAINVDNKDMSVINVSKLIAERSFIEASCLE